MNDPLRAQQMVRRQVRRRRRRRRARVAGLVLVATAAVLAAAVGIDRLAVVVHRFYVEHHHSARPRAAGHGPTTTATTATTVAGPVRCDSPQLSAIVSDWRQTNAATVEVVTLTNISSGTCSLSGYPRVGAAASNGTPQPAPNADLASLAAAGGTTTTSPTSSRPPGLVMLDRGERASFQLAFGDTCDHVLSPGQAATGAPDECYAGQWLEVTPPGGSSPLLVTQPLRLVYATAGFEVGPFQAGSGPPLATAPSAVATTAAPPTP